MKNRNLFIATLLVVVATSVAVVSCKKEKHETSSYNTEQAVQSADNMDEYLISFKKKLLSAQKGDETISLEQAERDLGNLLNFDFGDANYATDEFHDDTIRLKLNLSNGQVDLSQLAITYNAAVSSIINAYHAIDLPEKSVYAISCNFNDAESKDGETEDVEIILTTRGYLGEAMMPNSSDGWRPTYRGGTCDGQLVGVWGGARIVENWLNNDPHHQVPDCEYGRAYFTEITYSNIFADSPGMQIQHPNYNYRLYLTYYNNPDLDCLSVEDLQFYFQQAKSLRRNPNINFDPPIPSNHIILQYYLGMVASGYTNGVYHTPWKWHLQIKHGKFNCTGSGPLI